MLQLTSEGYFKIDKASVCLQHYKRLRVCRSFKYFVRKCLLLNKHNYLFLESFSNQFSEILLSLIYLYRIFGKALIPTSSHLTHLIMKYKLGVFNSQSECYSGFPMIYFIKIKALMLPSWKITLTTKICASKRHRDLL